MFVCGFILFFSFSKHRHCDFGVHSWHAVVYFQSATTLYIKWLYAQCVSIFFSAVITKNYQAISALASHNDVSSNDDVYCLPFADLFSFCSQQMNSRSAIEREREKNAHTKFVMNLIAECFMCFVVLCSLACVCLCVCVCERENGRQNVSFGLSHGLAARFLVQSTFNERNSNYEALSMRWTVQQ